MDSEDPGNELWAGQAHALDLALTEKNIIAFYTKLEIFNFRRGIGRNQWGGDSIVFGCMYQRYFHVNLSSWKSGLIR
jgi:hypothetical protein